MSGQRLQRRSLAPAGWSTQGRYPDPSQTSSGKSRRRSGLRRGHGPGGASLRRSTACQRAKSLMARWAGSTKRLVARYYQLKTGHARTEQYLHWAKVRPIPSAGGVCTPRKRETTCSRCVRSRQLQQKILRAEVQKETGKWMSRWKIRGPSHRQEVWAGDAGIPHLNRCGKAGATSGREGRRESGVRV